MRVMGLIGGVASGKSEVARMLEARGAVRIDADQLGHHALRQREIRESLVERFGRQILDSSGAIDRAVLGRMVFGPSDQAKKNRHLLEEIVHPWIRHQAMERLEALRNQESGSPPLVLLDAPLLLEAGWRPLCDWVVFLETPRERRMAWAAKRGWTALEWEQREASQLSLEQKREHATHILQNDSDLEHLEKQIDQHWPLWISRWTPGGEA
ncbi:MAG: dephospho-CoA kinase [Pirellulaceae bacterium]